jgi:hypothetical protein
MTAARLTVALFAALVFAPTAQARADAPRLTAPEGLRAFLLRADEPETHEYSRTPSFAWKPVARTVRYEFQLSTSDTFRDGGVIYRSSKLTTPVLSVPISLPWITGKQGAKKTYALYARVRAVTQTGTTPWTDDYGFDMRWTGRGIPEPMSSFPGLLRWTPIPGATAYQIWLPERAKRITTLTNVADERDVYTFHTAPKWTSTLQWRVRAVRTQYGAIATKLPAVSYGPWSQTFTAVNPPFAVGPLGGLATVSDTITDASEQPEAHRLTPGFVYTGNQTIFDVAGVEDDPELYRVYAFTDSDCVNTVFTGSVVGSPAYAPRVTGPLELPDSLSGIASSRNRILRDLTGEGTTQFAIDGDKLIPNESQGPAYEGGGATEKPTEETPTEEKPGEEKPSEEPPSEEKPPESKETDDETPAEIPLKFTEDSTKIPPIELWDTKWPEGGYYWTVVGVNAVSPEPFETKLDAPAALGATTIVVEDAGSLETGNEIEIGLTPPEVATVKVINGNTITLESALTGPHFAGDEVVLSADTIVYKDAELPQDVCAAGRVLRFGKMSEPALTNDADGQGAPFVSGMSTTGRLIPATRTQALFYGSPIVAWNPALGAHGYEVQWSKKAVPFKAAATSIYTWSTSAVLPLKPGTWYYRVRGINLVLAPGAQPMAWPENPIKLVIAKPSFKIVK